MVPGLADSNPIPGLRGLLRMPASESKAVMTRKQIQKFYQALHGYRSYPETALCPSLIALSACRPGEAADTMRDMNLGRGTTPHCWRRPGAGNGVVKHR